MGRRYKFLDKESRFSALNKVRHAFLAAKNGEEVDTIIGAILTSDEKTKVGRRIEIAQHLLEGETFDEIRLGLKVGKDTVSKVEKLLSKNRVGFDLIFNREEKVEKEYKDKAYEETGSSKLLHKRIVYTGFRRKDVKR